eukprot:TRINITY_DN13784_c0_g2_i1.p1 TRINITY_DN13784_c0_g2~~TRINITY_DN13784_c0_g2_i1.p1  ORF type:complete len:222 (+),score=22.09 TRINITY_DN13784_c0_g2_i1:279-944(+)
MVAYENNYQVDVETAQNKNYSVNFYVQFWTKSDSLVFGIIVGCLYLEYKKKEENYKLLKKFCLKPFIKLLCYCIGIVGTFLLSWCFHVLTLHTVSYWTMGQHFVFLTFSRSAFCACFLIALFPDIITTSGFVYSFLANKIFAPLAKLVFTIYLMHLTIEMTKTYSMKQYFYFSSENLGYVFMTDFCFSCLAAISLALICEAPLLNIEAKYIFVRKPVKQTK